jgi:hypothetical protein
MVDAVLSLGTATQKSVIFIILVLKAVAYDQMGMSVLYNKLCGNPSGTDLTGMYFVVHDFIGRNLGDSLLLVCHYFCFPPPRITV